MISGSPKVFQSHGFLKTQNTNKTLIVDRNAIITNLQFNTMNFTDCYCFKVKQFSNLHTVDIPHVLWQ